MTAPEDPNGLREALARWLREWADRPGTLADGNTLADALIAGPLASLITERDEKCERLWGLWMAARDRALAAEAEITRLKAGMEALGAAMKPFARIGHLMGRTPPKRDVAIGWLAVDFGGNSSASTFAKTGDFLAAAEALEALSQEQPHG